MKRQPIVWLLLCLLLACGCKEDGYVYPSVLTELIDIQTNETGTITHLVADNGERYPVQYREGLNGLKEDTLYRTLSVYRFLSESDTEKEVMLYSCRQVMSPLPIQANELSEELKTDPVDIQSMWLSGDYLNMILLVRQKDQPHTFLFIDEGMEETGGTASVLQLRLFHDSHDDYEAFTDPAYLSVPLRSYSLRADDKIRFCLNTYQEGETFREFEY